jgi:hypothetical protein
MISTGRILFGEKQSAGSTNVTLFKQCCLIHLLSPPMGAQIQFSGSRHRVPRAGIDPYLGKLCFPSFAEGRPGLVSAFLGKPSAYSATTVVEGILWRSGMPLKAMGLGHFWHSFLGSPCSFLLSIAHDAAAVLPAGIRCVWMPIDALGLPSGSLHFFVFFPGKHEAT